MIQNFLTLLGSDHFNEKKTLQKLCQQLIACTYHENLKFLIERICMNLMKENNGFKTEILAFIENNRPQRFIEIGGILNYKYKGKQESVKAFMMFNQFFPHMPPYVRVVNYKQKKVNPYYESYESPNDKNSYVLNSRLNNITTWVPGNRCEPIFAELKYFLQTYPFYQDQIQQSQTSKKQSNKLKTEKNKQFIANQGSIYQSKFLEESPHQKNSKTSDDYSQKQCKLCFFSQSAMINTGCGHIMMCEACYNDYRQKKKGSDILECPLCKVKGQYFKFLQPKYA